MSDYKRIARARVDVTRVTGKTRHFRGADLLPPPHTLEIVQLPPDPGFYLLYLDEAGAEQTDTYHASIALAMEQAEYEFELSPPEWEQLS